MSSFLIYEQRGSVVTLTMNEPSRRNPLTGNTAIPEFLSAIQQLNGDSSVRAVVLTGAGTAFSSGGDIRDMRRYSDADVDGLKILQEYRTGIQRLALALFSIEVPVVAAINGPAMGAGLDIACMCDIRLAAERATFGETFVKLGIISGDGGAWLLPRLIGMSRASEMSLTGCVIDARRAAEWGLVSRWVANEDLLQEANGLADAIAEHPPHAVRLTKRLLREGLNMSLSALLELAGSYQALSHLTDAHRSAVNAFLARSDARRDR